MGLKLNIGSGTDYRAGFVNIDSNPRAKSDLCVDATELPFGENSVDYVMMRHSLEHIPREKVWHFFDRLYHVCRHGAVVEIWVPHFKGIHACHPQHATLWGSTSFEPTNVNNPARTTCGAEHYTDFTCKVLDVKLHFWMEGVAEDVRAKSKKFKLYWLNCKWFWNCGGSLYRQFWERFNPFGFDEVYYKLKVIKPFKSADAD